MYNNIILITLSLCNY